MMFLLEKKIALVTFQDVEGVCLWIMTGLLSGAASIITGIPLFSH
jgi:hypothetical protein